MSKINKPLRVTKNIQDKFDARCLFTGLPNPELDQKLAETAFLEIDTSQGTWQFRRWRGEIQSGEMLYRQNEQLWVVRLQRM